MSIMALQGLQHFVCFDLDAFLQGKRLIYIKALPWTEKEEQRGSKVVLQIFEDNTRYARSDISNFGEQLTVKVRGASPDAFSQLKPLQTEVVINQVENSSVYGEYRNQLSITGTIGVKQK